MGEISLKLKRATIVKLRSGPLFFELRLATQPVTYTTKWNLIPSAHLSVGFSVPNCIEFLTVFFNINKKMDK
jgi:hypothetical protein